MRSFMLAAIAAAAFLVTPVVPASAEIGVNSVCFFWRNDTYRCVDWDMLDTVDEDRRFTMIVVYHVQAPGDTPNMEHHSGRYEEIGLKRTRRGLTMRFYESPNGRDSKSYYEDFTQAPRSAWDGANGSLMAAVKTHLQSRAFGGNYVEQEGRAWDKSWDLRTVAVPTNGTY